MLTKEQSKKHPIRYIAEKTGVKPITLRAWEKRYNLLCPQRTEKGHRFYSDDDILLVQRVLVLLSQGYSISKAADAIRNYDDYELIGKGKNKHLISFDSLDKAIKSNNVSLAIKELAELYAIYSPEVFSQVIYPSVINHLNQAIWPNIDCAEILQSMFLDGIYMKLSQIINQNNKSKAQKKVLVIGYKTSMVKNLIIHGLLIANILNARGLNVQFCSGVSSKDFFDLSSYYDAVIIFARSDEFNLYQLDKSLKNSAKPYYISIVGKQHTMNNLHVLPCDYSEIFHQIKL